jgi:polysaccharide export outer membrane protein
MKHRAGRRTGWRSAAALGIVLVSLLATPLRVEGQQDPAMRDDAVRPGDRIALRIWNEPLMSDTFRIAETGVVTLPKLGPVPAAGQNAEELQHTLREAYSAFLRNPAVEVTVLRRIGVQGEVLKPGLYLVDLTMTVSDVIATAGGITQQGNPQKVFLVRDGQRSRVGGDALARFTAAELRSGDHVLIGRRSWFELNSLAIVGTAAVLVSVVVPLLQAAF